MIRGRLEVRLTFSSYCYLRVSVFIYGLSSTLQNSLHASSVWWPKENNWHAHSLKYCHFCHYFEWVSCIRLKLPYCAERQDSPAVLGAFCRPFFAPFSSSDLHAILFYIIHFSFYIQRVAVWVCVFLAWLISLTTLSCSFIQVAKTDRISIFSLWPNNTAWCTHTTFLFYLFINEHVGWIHSLIIVNSLIHN